jgi:hypothetical protein
MTWVSVMPHLKIDHEQRHVEVDLHGYGLSQARRVAREKVREAWENGFRRITLVHGGAAAVRPGAAWSQRYGVIKWQLRGLFRRGRWRQYLVHGGSRKHRLDEGAMRLAVRPNPEPRTEPRWSPLPGASFG